MHLKRQIVENAEDGHPTVVEEEEEEARTRVPVTESVNVKYRPHASTDEREYRPDTGSSLLLFILTRGLIDDVANDTGSGARRVSIRVNLWP